MYWHPTLNPTAMIILVTGAACVLVVSFILVRRQLDPTTLAGALVIGLRITGFGLLVFMVLQPSRLPPAQKVTTQKLLPVLVDTSASMSLGTPARLDQARMLMRDNHLLEQVAAWADSALYRFDAQAVPLKNSALDALVAAGKQTDLIASIEQTVKQHQNRYLAGILVLTDGRHTQDDDPRKMALRLKTPIYVVPVGLPASMDDDDGTASTLHDLAIESVSAEPRIILGNKARVVAMISAKGYQARQVTVELLQNNRVLSSSAVAVDPKRPSRQVLFSVAPSKTGTHRYHLRIEPEPVEDDPTNNLVEFAIEVVDPINRLLYLDRMRYERRFLKAVIEAHKKLLYTAIVQQDDKRVIIQGNDAQMKKAAAILNDDQLRSLKAIILGDIPAESLTAQQITALVRWVDRGGSLMLLAGPQSMGRSGFGHTPLAQLLPVQVLDTGKTGGYIEAPYRVQLTGEGAAHPAFQKVHQQWQAAPSLLSRFGVDKVLPASTVIVATQGEPSRPIVVSRRYGHGKVAIVLTDSTWRWQLGFSPRRSDSKSLHHVFWTQMIDWLLPDLRQKKVTEGQVQLMTDRMQYEVNDPVTLRARVRPIDGQFTAQLAVKFLIRLPDPNRTAIKRTGLLQLPNDETGQTLFTATFDASVAGDYSIQVVVKQDGKLIGVDQTSIVVTQSLVEFMHTDPDLTLLRDLAKLSGGAYLKAWQLKNIASVIDLSPREVLIHPSAAEDAEPMWDRWWLLALFIVVMTGEWFVRRVNQWV